MEEVNGVIGTETRACGVNKNMVMDSEGGGKNSNS